MGSQPNEKTPNGSDLAETAHKQRERRRRSLEDGRISAMRHLMQIGVLGWIVLVPALLGLLLGRILDGRFGSGVFWSAPLLMLGLALGGWSAWRWVNRQ